MAAVGEAAVSAKCCIRIFFRLICSVDSLFPTHLNFQGGEWVNILQGKS